MMMTHFKGTSKMMAYIRTSGTSKQQQWLLSILFLHVFLCMERSEHFTCQHLLSFSDNLNRSACTAMQTHSRPFQTSLARPGYLSQWSTRAWCLPPKLSLPSGAAWCHSEPQKGWQTEVNLSEPLWRTQPQLPTGVGLLLRRKGGE